MKTSHIIIAALVFALALSGLFSVKFVAKNKERELRTLQSQVQDDQRAIRVLKAEWAYLNRPDNIQDLAVKYLGLRPLAPKHIYGGLPALPWRVASGKIEAPLVDFVMTPPDDPVRLANLGKQASSIGGTEVVLFEVPLVGQPQLVRQPIDAISLLMASDISLVGGRP